MLGIFSKSAAQKLFNKRSNDLTRQGNFNVIKKNKQYFRAVDKNGISEIELHVQDNVLKEVFEIIIPDVYFKILESKENNFGKLSKAIKHTSKEINRFECYYENCIHVLDFILDWDRTHKLVMQYYNTRKQELISSGAIIIESSSEEFSDFFIAETKTKDKFEIIRDDYHLTEIHTTLDKYLYDHLRVNTQKSIGRPPDYIKVDDQHCFGWYDVKFETIAVSIEFRLE